MDLHKALDLVAKDASGELVKTPYVSQAKDTVGSALHASREETVKLLQQRGLSESQIRGLESMHAW